MLKLRIEGMKEDIYKYIDYIRRDYNLNILNISNCYANHGISQYHRAFVEMDVSDLKTIQLDNECDKTEKEQWTKSELGGRENGWQQK